MAITVEVRWSNPGRLQVIKDNLENPEYVLGGIGAYVKAQSAKRFREQGSPPNSWPGRMNPNVPGIIADMNNGASIKARRFQDRPALIDTRNLQRSVDWLIRGKDMVVISSNAPDAEKHQHGGETESEPITAEGQRNLARLIKRNKKAAPKGPPPGNIRTLRAELKRLKDQGIAHGEWHDMVSGRLKRAESRWTEASGENMYAGLSWLLNKKLVGQRIKINVRARPFIELNDEEIEDLKGIVVRRLLRRSPGEGA